MPINPFHGCQHVQLFTYVRDQTQLAATHFGFFHVSVKDLSLKNGTTYHLIADKIESVHHGAYYTIYNSYDKFTTTIPRQALQCIES